MGSQGSLAEGGGASGLGGGASLEDLGEFLANYGGPSLSQDGSRTAWSPATPTRSVSHERSLGGPSPQRSPHLAHRIVPSALSSNPPVATPTPTHGFSAPGDVVSTSWANIPAALTTEEEEERQGRGEGGGEREGGADCCLPLLLGR